MVSLGLTLWDLPAEHARPLMSRINVRFHSFARGSYCPSQSFVLQGNQPIPSHGVICLEIDIAYDARVGVEC